MNRPTRLGAPLQVVAPEALWLTLKEFQAETGRNPHYIGCYWPKRLA